MASLYGIQLRTGCFCNMGACQRHLKLSSQRIISNFQVCVELCILLNSAISSLTGPLGAVEQT